MTTNVLCAHHWIIEEAAGPTSMGRCKYCRQTKEFFNSAPSTDRLKDYGQLAYAQRHRQDGIIDVR